jgi:hypothetical protein
MLDVIPYISIRTYNIVFGSVLFLNIAEAILMRKLVLLIFQGWYIPQQQAAVNSRNITKFKTLRMALLMFCKKISEFIGLIF